MEKTRSRIPATNKSTKKAKRRATRSSQQGSQAGTRAGLECFAPCLLPSPPPPSSPPSSQPFEHGDEAPLRDPSRWPARDGCEISRILFESKWRLPPAGQGVWGNAWPSHVLTRRETRASPTSEEREDTGKLTHKHEKWQRASETSNDNVLSFTGSLLQQFVTKKDTVMYAPVWWLQ